MELTGKRQAGFRYPQTIRLSPFVCPLPAHRVTPAFSQRGQVRQNSASAAGGVVGCEFRKLRVEKFLHSLVYRYLDGEIQILAVAHMS
jgi:hypothetical protein